MADEETFEAAGRTASEEVEEMDDREDADSDFWVDPPVTVLPVILSEDVGGLIVSLIGSPSDTPDLQEVNRVNVQEGAATKTPLMTVIKAVLRARGGRMSVRELADETSKNWGRPFPSSPYTPEEFMFMMTRNSDSLKIESLSG